MIKESQKLRSINQDMWQRYNDCIICDCKSIPNVQGLIIDSRNRNILVAFNKVLHVWRFEKPESVLKNSPFTTYNNATPLELNQRAQGIFTGQLNNSSSNSYWPKV